MKFKLLPLVAAAFLMVGCNNVSTPSNNPSDEPGISQPGGDIEGPGGEIEGPGEGEEGPGEIEGPGGEIEGPGGESEEKDTEVSISFAGIDASSTLNADTLKDLLNCELVTSVTDVDSVYAGAGTGGAHANEFGLVKLGTSKKHGVFTLELSKAIKEVRVMCHDFYALSADHPTNSNYLSINEDAKLAPYNETGAAEELVFTLAEPSSTLKFDANLRVYVWSITLVY